MGLVRRNHRPALQLDGPSHGFRGGRGGAEEEIAERALSDRHSTRKPVRGSISERNARISEQTCSSVTGSALGLGTMWKGQHCTTRNASLMRNRWRRSLGGCRVSAANDLSNSSSKSPITSRRSMLVGNGTAARASSRRLLPWRHRNQNPSESSQLTTTDRRCPIHGRLSVYAATGSNLVTHSDLALAERDSGITSGVTSHAEPTERPARTRPSM